MPASYDDHDPEMDFDAFNKYLLATSGPNDLLFPGWFVTSFDEEDLLPGFGFGGKNPGAHGEGSGQGRHKSY